MRRRKRPNPRRAVCGIMVAAALVCGSALAAARQVRVGIYQNPPKVGLCEAGKPQGIFVDIIEEVAEREGWTIEYVPGTWTEGLDRLEAGEIDLMPDVAYSPSREAIYAFHRETVLSDWFQIYARRGAGIESLLDLGGKRVAVLERSVQQEAFERALSGFDVKAQLVTFVDYGNAFGAVVSGEVDAVITNRFYGAKHAGTPRIVDTAIIFSPTRLFYAAPKGASGELHAAIDRQLLRMKGDTGSVYYRSLRHWTSENVAPRFPPWLKTAALAVAAALVAFLAWSMALRRQVASRTRQLAARNEENARLYQQVQRYAGELEVRVEERTRELEEVNRRLVQARDAAESADRLKSAFLATMSHELRTPLNSIIGFTGILLQGLAGPLNGEQEKQLRMVQASSRHLLALINDVLDISKIEAGQLTVERALFDLRGSIEHVVETVVPAAERQGLVLRLNLVPEIGAMVGDRRRFEQVLMNVLSNAIKFTEAGSVTVDCAVEGDEVAVAVADTGIGIAPGDLSRLFRPFEQIDSGLSRKHEGTGLGLSICRRLLELMGGSIVAESEFGKGSVFTFRLPLGRQQEERP